MRVTIRFAAGLAICLVAACGGSSAAVEGKATSRAEFEQAGLAWPLTVENGRIGCDGLAAWFQSDDAKKYGLNGLASEARGYAPIEPIWAVDEQMMGDLKSAGMSDGPVIRISIGDMISEANKLCS